jgi:hypothetical protein
VAWYRYSKFRALQEQLQAIFDWVPDIDGGRLTGNLDPQVTQARKDDLNRLLTAMVLHCTQDRIWEKTVKNSMTLQECKRHLHQITAAAFPPMPKFTLQVFIVKDDQVLSTICEGLSLPERVKSAEYPVEARLTFLPSGVEVSGSLFGSTYTERVDM